MSADSSQLVEEQGKVTTSRGVQLFTQTLSPKGAPAAVIVYHHGFGEHCDRHLETLRHLARNTRSLVVAYDAHGHGRSGPDTPRLRAFVASWKHLVQDLGDVVDKVALPSAKARGAPDNVKVFVMGHSMGGMTAVLLSLQRPGALSGLLLSSPLVSVTPNNSWAEWAQIAVLRLLCLLIPHRPLLKRRTVEAGIRDPKAQQAVREDTLWYRDPIKTRTVVTCIDGTLEIQARAREVMAPLYVQQGTLDKTCNVRALRQLLPRLGSQDVTYHEVQGGLHDLMLDLETPECHRRMVAWIKERL